MSRATAGNIDLNSAYKPMSSLETPSRRVGWHTSREFTLNLVSVFEREDVSMEMLRHYNPCGLIISSVAQAAPLSENLASAK